MTMQRLIDRLKHRTYVRLECPCGSSLEWSNPTDPEHDYYEPRGPKSDNGNLTDDQAKRLADLIQFIDQEENQHERT